MNSTINWTILLGRAFYADLNEEFVSNHEVQLFYMVFTVITGLIQLLIKYTFYKIIVKLSHAFFT